MHVYILSGKFLKNDYGWEIGVFYFKSVYQSYEKYVYFYTLVFVEELCVMVWCDMICYNKILSYFMAHKKVTLLTLYNSYCHLWWKVEDVEEKYQKDLS